MALLPPTLRRSGCYTARFVRKQRTQKPKKSRRPTVFHISPASDAPAWVRHRLGLSFEDAALALNTEFLVFLDQHVLVQGPIRHAPAMGSTGSTGTIGSYAAWGLEERRSMVLAEEMTSLGQERVPWPAGGWGPPCSLSATLRDEHLPERERDGSVC